MSDAAKSHHLSPAWATPRELAEAEVEALVDDPLDERIFNIVQAVFATLEEPDRDMIAAGITVLDLAVSRQRPIDQRDLVKEIFIAMIREAAK